MLTQRLMRLPRIAKMALLGVLAAAAYRTRHTEASASTNDKDQTERARADELRHLSRHLLLERETERAGIARELHDELGSSLTAVNMDMSWIMQRLGDQPALASRLARAKQVLASTVERKRRIIHDLRPSMLDNLGLGPAIESHVGEVAQRLTVPITVDVQDDLFGLNADCVIALYRIFQEALSNAARHSAANGITVSLRQQDNNVVLEVSDDGIGLNRGSAICDGKPSLGLLSMRERARAVGGDLVIGRREDGKGTLIRATVPCVAESSG